jgi:hypothetical protein
VFGLRAPAVPGLRRHALPGLHRGLVGLTQRRQLAHTWRSGLLSTCSRPSSRRSRSRTSMPARFAGKPTSCGRRPAPWRVPRAALDVEA